MYAIVETGGKQYKVSTGQVIKVDKTDAKAGEYINLKNVLLISKDDGVVSGDPYIEGAEVKASVIETAKDKKILVFKMKPRKGYRRLRGHRQYYTKIKIDEIVYGG